MANKNVFRVIFAILVFSLIPFSSFSEESDEWQILEWEELDPGFVLYYNVFVERYDSKKDRYEKVLEAKTEGAETNLTVNPKLAPGRYRYKIVTYDLLGLEAAESDWFDFTIIRAYQPRITGISSAANGSSTLYLEEFNDGIFTVDGRNLFVTKDMLSEEDIKSTDGIPVFTEYKLINKKTGNALIPEILSHDDSNRKMRIFFDMNFLDQGVYDLVATDASGLGTADEKNNTITVKFKKRFDFDLSAGYDCPIVLYDTTINDYMGSPIWPISGYAKFSFMFSKHNFGYFGAGFNAHYTYMPFEQSAYSINGNIIDGYLNFVYQIPIYKLSKSDETKRKHTMTLEFRAGIGLLLFNNFVFEFANNVSTEPYSSMNLSAQLGFDVQFYFKNRLFLETGFDFVNTFTSDMAFGEFIPKVGVGWQF